MEIIEYNSILNTTDCCDENKALTLIAASEILMSRVKDFENLVELSNDLVSKMYRTEVLNKVKESKSPSPTILNIAEIFKNIADKLKDCYNEIGSNIDHVIKMIE